MFWKKKIKDPQRSDPTVLEYAIINHLTSILSNEYQKKLTEQMEYLKLIKRLKYSKESATEFYPEKFGIIPETALFDKKDDFCLSRIKFKTSEQVYKAEIYFVLGTLFEIRVKPIPENINTIKTEDIQFVSASIEERFDGRIK
jgi:hypothetical protein